MMLVYRQRDCTGLQLFHILTHYNSDKHCISFPSPSITISGGRYIPSPYLLSINCATSCHSWSLQPSITTPKSISLLYLCPVLAKRQAPRFVRAKGQCWVRHCHKVATFPAVSGCRAETSICDTLYFGDKRKRHACVWPAPAAVSRRMYSSWRLKVTLCDWLCCRRTRSGSTAGHDPGPILPSTTTPIRSTLMLSSNIFLGLASKRFVRETIRISSGLLPIAVR